MTSNLFQVLPLLRGRAELPHHTYSLPLGLFGTAPTNLWLSCLLCFGFLVHHSLVEFYLQKPRNKDTNIVVTFFSSNVTSSAQITM